MDGLTLGLSATTRIRLTYAEVTETARELERRHLAGPTAAELMGRGLTAAALLSTNLGGTDETIQVQLRTDGPIGGLVAECSVTGDLRGYPHIKILNDLDGMETPDLQAALGGQGSMQVIHSSSAKVIQSGVVSATPPDLQHNLARYYYESLQIPTGVALHSARRDGYLATATGLAIEKMPDGDTPAFVNVLERFEDGQVAAALGRGAPVQEIAALLNLHDLTATETRPLQFACRCSREKVAYSVSTLSRDELAAMIEAQEPQEVTCHFCGETYRISLDGLREILSKKTGN